MVEEPIRSLVLGAVGMDPTRFYEYLDKLPDTALASQTKEAAIKFYHQERGDTLEPTPEQEDGYPIPTDKRPITWPVNDFIADELEHLYEEIYALGVDEIKIGTEIEFIPKDTTIPTKTSWEEQKEYFIENLSGAASIAFTDEERAELIAKANAFKEFGPKDVMMYDLIEENLETMLLLEPLFGKTRDGTGYYDGDNILELKLNPVSPQQQIENRKIVLNALYEKATEYGLEIKDKLSFHLNFSFWKYRKNLLDPEHPEFATTGKAIAEGMTRAAYDIIPSLIDTDKLDKELRNSISLKIDRDTFLRSATGRIELRSGHLNEIQDTDACLVFMLAGAVHGLKDNPDLLPAKQINKTKIWHVPGHFHETTQIIGNSVIKGNGHLIPPYDYILYNAEKLALELGIISKHDSSAFADKQKYTPHILSFFKNIKIDTENKKIIFPKNEESTEAFAEASGNQEGDKKTYTIDITALENNLQLKSITQALVVDTGYDINDVFAFEDREHPIESARLNRMIESKVLEETSPEFHDALKRTLIDKFPEILGNHTHRDSTLEETPEHP